MADSIVKQKTLTVVTYDFVSGKAKALEIDHNDTSALGLNIVAIVEGVCREKECMICSAIQRRIRSRLGIYS